MRGLALFGILLINLQVFGTTFFLFDQSFDTHTGKADGIIWRSIMILVTQRFIGIFSLLFGLGLAIQLQNFQKRGSTFVHYYLRRTFLLFIFGCINLCLLFWGDILMIYTIYSLLLMFSFKRSNETISVAAAVLFLVPGLLYAIVPFRLYFEMLRFSMLHHFSLERFVHIYRSGTTMEMLNSRVLNYYYSYLPDLTWHRTSFAYILLGYYFGRNNFHSL